jgi:competence protein ComEA
MELDWERIRVVGWVVAAILVALVAVRALAAGGEQPGSVAVDPAPAAAQPAGGGGSLAVQVAGEVRRPGVYQVPAGARVHEAIEQAGGLTRRADQAGVNLVAKVADGQQVIVPRRGVAVVGGAGAAGGAGGGGAPGAGGAAGPKVSLGSATAEQLDAIDGIGPTLARRIVEYRQKTGGFSSVEQLRQVDGIGEKRFESLREAVAP